MLCDYVVYNISIMQFCSACSDLSPRGSGSIISRRTEREETEMSKVIEWVKENPWKAAVIVFAVLVVVAWSCGYVLGCASGC